MAHVGIERLGPGHRQENAAQDDESHPAVGDQEGHAVVGQEGPHDGPVVEDVEDAQGAEHKEPGGHDRAEEGRDAVGAAGLDHEQGHQHTSGDGNEIGLDADAHAGRFLQALDGREHRNGRGDDPVAVEQRRADHPEEEHRRGALGQVALGQAMSARVPPSPLLSARIRKTTYLMVTMSTSAQITRETTPSTASSLAPPEREWWSASFMA
jgi:hypothetical protein